MNEQPTATLTFSEFYAENGWSPWILRPTNRIWRQPFWKFRNPGIARQFAARRGIRIEPNQESR